MTSQICMQSYKSLNRTTEELEQFFGTALYMSIFKLPSTRMIWNSSSRIPQVADTMMLGRWEVTKKCLHFNDNMAQPARGHSDFDELYKVRPLITHLVKKMNDIPMAEKLSVDEQMVP
ncbi:UNVERIFIED_CONTAM: hypothetical protein FKN15_025232 [Acipenser sinensis]